MKNSESSVQARSLVMKDWGCDHFYKHKKAAVNTSNYTVRVSGMLAGLIVDWKREDSHESNGEKEIEKKEILDTMSFVKDR